MKQYNIDTYNTSNPLYVSFFKKVECMKSVSTYKVEESTYNQHVKPYLEDIRQLKSIMTSPEDILKHIEKVSGIYIPAILFSRYIDLYPELKEAWNTGSHILAHKLEQAAIKMSLGYDYEESETCYIKDPNSESGEKILAKKVRIRHVKPDPTMLKKSLEVFNGDKWKDNSNSDNIVVVQFKDKELDEFSG